MTELCQQLALGFGVLGCQGGVVPGVLVIGAMESVNYGGEHLVCTLLLEFWEDWRGGDVLEEYDHYRQRIRGQVSYVAAQDVVSLCQRAETKPES